MDSFIRYFKSVLIAVLLLFIGAVVLAIIASGSAIIFLIAIGAVALFIGYCIAEGQKETDEDN